jgi:hypothetical protein
MHLTLGTACSQAKRLRQQQSLDEALIRVLLYVYLLPTLLHCICYAAGSQAKRLCQQQSLDEALT